MSYCRFSEGDVYLYAHVSGGIECCACRLAPLVPTIFTKGDGVTAKIMGVTGPCKHCGGKGCDGCMMHGSIRLATPEDAIEHMEAHRNAGHEFPDEVIDELREEVRSTAPESGTEPVSTPAK